MKRLITALFFIMPFQVILAQHTISGIISDKADNSALLEGVSVYVPEFEKVDVSREGGTYLIRNAGVGVVHIQFMKEGYETQVQIVSVTDSVTVINAEMLTNGMSSRRATTPLLNLPQNNPYSIEQFDANRLRRMGQPKLLTSLAYEPGVDAITLGQITKPVIRGLSGNHVLMIQSGSRILSNRLDERYDYELIDNGTEEVEIVKGPSALLYGDNAMGGVIIFKDEKMPSVGTVSGDVNLAFYTSTLGLKSDAGIKGSSANGLFYSVRLGGASHTSYVQGEGFEQTKNTEVKNYAYNSGMVASDAKGIIGVSRKWGQTRLTVSYMKKQSELIQSYTQSEIDTMEDINERDRKTMAPFIDQESILASSQTTILLKKSRLDANVSWQSYSRDGSYTTHAINYDVKYTTDPSRKYGFIFGSQGYYQNKDYAAYYSIYKNKLLSNSVYLLGRYDFEKVNILGGARYDMKKLTTPDPSLDHDYNFFNGSLGISWHPAEDFTIKINGASGNSVPDEERYYYNHMYYGYLSSLEINQEVNRELDLGFEWSQTSVTVNIDAFNNWIDNYTYRDIYYINQIPVPDQYILRQSDGKIDGGEAKLSIHPVSVEWLNVNVGYSILHGEFENGYTMPGIPAGKITAAARFQSKRMNYLYNSFVEVMMRSYMKQDEIFRTETSTENYTLLDLRIGGSFHWAMQSFDVTLAVNNILDTQYYSHLSMTKNLEPVPVTDVGRNVALMLRFPFGL